MCIEREKLTLKGKMILATIGCFAEKYIYLNWRCVIAKGWMFCANLEHKPIFHGHLGLEIKKKTSIFNEGDTVFTEFFCFVLFW